MATASGETVHVGGDSGPCSRSLESTDWPWVLRRMPVLRPGEWTVTAEVAEDEQRDDERTTETHDIHQTSTTQRQLITPSPHLQLD